MTFEDIRPKLVEAVSKMQTSGKEVKLYYDKEKLRHGAFVEIFDWLFKLGISYAVKHEGTLLTLTLLSEAGV